MMARKTPDKTCEHLVSNADSHISPIEQGMACWLVLASCDGAAYKPRKPVILTQFPGGTP